MAYFSPDMLYIVISDTFYSGVAHHC